MGLNRDELVLFHKPWFDEAVPTNAAKATGTLTLASTPVATETVTIGTEVYEFVAPDGEVASASNFAVIMSATPTADDGVTKLAAAIVANSSLVTAVASTPNDTVVVTAKLVGTEGNAIATTETMSNGSWAAALLAGGLYATPCKASMAAIEISGTKYFTTKPVDKFSETGWYSVSLTDL